MNISLQQEQRDVLTRPREAWRHSSRSRAGRVAALRQRKRPPRSGVPAIPQSCASNSPDGSGAPKPAASPHLASSRPAAFCLRAGWRAQTDEPTRARVERRKMAYVAFSPGKARSPRWSSRRVKRRRGSRTPSLVGVQGVPLPGLRTRLARYGVVTPGRRRAARTSGPSSFDRAPAERHAGVRHLGSSSAKGGHGGGHSGSPSRKASCNLTKSASSRS